VERFGDEPEVGDFVDEEACGAILRVTGGNFRVLETLLLEIERLLEVNEMKMVTNIGADFSLSKSRLVPPTHSISPGATLARQFPDEAASCGNGKTDSGTGVVNTLAHASTATFPANGDLASGA